MKSKILEKFISEQKAIYGSHFFLEKLPSGKIVLMTEKLANKLRDELNDPSVTIVSLDKDETVGTYFRVKLGKAAKIIHYYRDSKEMDRLLHRLSDTKMISLAEEEGETSMTNELMAGELFRGIKPKEHKGWLVAAVDHDFENEAPKVLGWVKIDENIKSVSGKKLSRPKRLREFKDIFKELLGLPYHLGGKSDETGYDCSSMVQKILFEKKGIWLPKLAAWQFGAADEVKESDLTIGDLVFFTEPPGETIEHVAIISSVSDGGYTEIIHASPFHGKVIAEEFLVDVLAERGLKIKSYGRF